jgi:hypothetical protein
MLCYRWWQFAKLKGKGMSIRIVTMAVAGLSVVACTVNQQFPTTSAPVQASSTSTPANNTLERAALSGVRQNIGHLISLNPDCSYPGKSTVRVITSPSHGEFTMEDGQDYPAYRSDNQRYVCNMKKVPAIMFYYTSNPAYVGPDSVSVQSIGLDGTVSTNTYNITVGSP